MVSALLPQILTGKIESDNKHLSPYNVLPHLVTAIAGSNPRVAALKLLVTNTLESTTIYPKQLPFL